AVSAQVGILQGAPADGSPIRLLTSQDGPSSRIAIERHDATGTPRSDAFRPLRSPRHPCRADRLRVAKQMSSAECEGTGSCTEAEILTCCRIGPFPGSSGAAPEMFGRRARPGGIAQLFGAMPGRFSNASAHTQSAP